MRGGFLEKALASYFAIGGLWCFLSNFGAALTGRTSAFVVVTGSASASDKLLAVLRIVLTQIVLWPMDLWQSMGRTVFG